MPTPDYYRHQAQLCARLARFAEDPLTAERYQALALELLVKADQMDSGPYEAGSQTGSDPGTTKGKGPL